MARSMTGYGKSVIERDDRIVTVELSSLNSKHLNLSFSFDDDPRLREQVAEKIRERLERGKVQVTIQGDVLDDRIRHSSIHRESLQFYLKQVRALQEEKQQAVGPADPVRLLQLPGVLTIDTEVTVDEEARPLLMEALGEALEEIVEMRQEEGEAIARDLKERTKSIGETLKQIEDRIPDSLENHRERYQNRVQDVADLTPEEMRDRVEKEMKVYVEKCDIAEEITRLQSHLTQIRDTLDKSGAIGKKLKFLFQELLREINTVGAKANDARISQLAVDVKTEIEKCREQVRNLE